MHKTQFMKNILIIFGSHSELPKDGKGANILHTMKYRMEHLKAGIFGHNVLSFDLSKDLDEEEELDLANAIKGSDELVVFDYQLSSPEVLPLIQERMWALGHVIFFEEEGDEEIKKSFGKYPHIKVLAYPQHMIDEMMKLENAK